LKPVRMSAALLIRVQMIGREARRVKASMRDG
jgi:hypothetical protein